MSNFYEADGVIAWEHQEYNCPSFLGVSDERFRHYRLTFGPADDGTISVSVGAEWSDDRPGELAALTHDGSCTPRVSAGDTLSISDDGLLTVMQRAYTASSVDFRSGFMVQLPREFVVPVRRAIAKAWEMAAARKERGA